MNTIDLAPKDARILLWCPVRGFVCGNWSEDKYAKKPRPYWTNDLEYLFGKTNTRTDQPTHWLPLPHKPKT
jgi:hypothetical protein